MYSFIICFKVIQFCSYNFLIFLWTIHLLKLYTNAESKVGLDHINIGTKNKRHRKKSKRNM